LCDICEKHTKHKKIRWYLDPDSYKDELIEKDPKRKDVLMKITGYNLEWYIYKNSWMTRIVDKLPWPLKSLGRSIANKAAYKLHAGQVIPIEEAIQVAEIAHNHVIIPCYCRRLTGDHEELTCLNFGMVKYLWPKYRPDDRVEELDKNTAIEMLREWDEKGYVHAVFWAKLPYVIAICNCEKKYCTAMKNRVVYGVENAYKKSHYIATIDPEICDGCDGTPQCALRCQFGAIRYDPSKKIAEVDPYLCFGCGLCRNACDEGAIKLVEREKYPIPVGW